MKNCRIILIFLVYGVLILLRFMVQHWFSSVSFEKLPFQWSACCEFDLGMFLKPKIMVQMLLSPAKRSQLDRTVIFLSH
jgi:hypothetical protein